MEIHELEVLNGIPDNWQRFGVHLNVLYSKWDILLCPPVALASWEAILPKISFMRDLWVMSWPVVRQQLKFISFFTTENCPCFHICFYWNKAFISLIVRCDIGLKPY